MEASRAFAHITQRTNSFNQNKQQYFSPKNKHYYSLLQIGDQSTEGFNLLAKITKEILNPDFESEKNMLITMTSSHFEVVVSFLTKHSITIKKMSGQ